MRMQKDSLRRQSKLFEEKRNSSSSQSTLSRSNDEISRILADLKRDKLITDRGDLIIVLNNLVLSVNDNEVPDAVYKRYKEKYLHKEGDLISYAREGNRVTQTIRRN